jgi:hypothetical protein
MASMNRNYLRCPSFSMSKMATMNRNYLSCPSFSLSEMATIRFATAVHGFV